MSVQYQSLNTFLIYSGLTNPPLWGPVYNAISSLFLLFNNYSIYYGQHTHIIFINHEFQSPCSQTLALGCFSVCTKEVPNIVYNLF